MSVIKKMLAGSIASLVLLIASHSANSFCIIYHQEELPAKVRNLKRKY